jgi:two-component system sensor histidine kinase BarA
VPACRHPVPNKQFELMARLSHELRTALTGIVGYAEFLESNSAESMVNFTAKIIRESSEILARSSNSFFDLHHLELGLIQINCSEFSMSELVRSVFRSHQKQALECNVTLIFTCSAETSLLNTYADPQRVRQVVDALFFDAVHAARKGASIHVDISFDDDEKSIKLMIIYLDSLIDEAQIEMHNEFWNDEHYQFRLQEGPGVELALAKSLIYFMQGHAEYLFGSSELPRLMMRLPMRYMGVVPK